MKLRMTNQFPEEPYSEMLANISSKWDERQAAFSNASGGGSRLRYVPSVSTGWDSSPRTLIHDPFGSFGYPWGPSFHATPEQFGDAMSLAKTWAEDPSRCSKGGVDALGCPPILVNAWNEWSEGVSVTKIDLTDSTR
jgi:hypothetical protein